MPVFRIDVFKGWRNRDMEQAWSNSYEINSTDTVVSSLSDTALAIVAAERLLHVTFVEFLQVRISTWAEEAGGVYDPASFTTIPLTGTGSRDNGGGDVMDYNVTFTVKRVPGSGRAGRLFYRGVLLESEVSANGSGRFQITPTSNLLDGGTTWEAYRTAMNEIISEEDPGVSGQLVMQSLIGTTPTTRPVLDLVPGGVSINKKNHRYFDRA